MKWRDYVARLNAYRFEIVDVLATEQEAREREKAVAACLQPALGFNSVYGGRA